MTVLDILIRGLCMIAMGAIVISGLLFIVGETVEHFAH